MYTVASPDPNPRGGGQLTLALTYTIYTGEGGQLPNPKSAILR